MELVWQWAMTVSWPLSSFMALRSILWDMVLVKQTRRSGEPSLFFKLPMGFANTLA